MKRIFTIFTLFLFCSCSSITINGISTKNTHPKGLANREVNIVAACCFIGAFIGNNVINGK